MLGRANLHSVAFTGVDGAGKSTQVALLEHHLRSGAAHVLVVHPYGSKVLKRFPARARARARSGPVHPRPDARPRGAALIAVADLAEHLLYLWFGTARGWARAVRDPARPTWLVGDRSFDDVVAKHDRRRALPRGVLEGVRRLAPPFETTILLRIDPMLALARDGDFEPGYYHRTDAVYAEVARRRGHHVVAVGHDDPRAVADRVRKVLGRSGQGPG